MTTGYQYTIREMQMVLVAAALASFLSPFLGSMVNVAIPAIGEAYVAPMLQPPSRLQCFLQHISSVR